MTTWVLRWGVWVCRMLTSAVVPLRNLSASVRRTMPNAKPNGVTAGSARVR